MDYDCGDQANFFRLIFVGTRIIRATVAASIVSNSSDAMSALAISIFFIAGDSRQPLRHLLQSRVTQFGERSTMTLLQPGSLVSLATCLGVSRLARSDIQLLMVNANAFAVPFHQITEVNLSVANSQDRRILELQGDRPTKARPCPGPEANVNCPTILIIWRKLHVTSNKCNYTGARGVPLAQF